MPKNKCPNCGFIFRKARHYQRSYVENRIKLGKCAQCGRPRKLGNIRCEKCLEKNRNYKRARKLNELA